MSNNNQKIDCVLTVSCDWADDVIGFHNGVMGDIAYATGAGPLIHAIKKGHGTSVDRGPTHEVWIFEGEATSGFGLEEAAFAVPQLKFVLSWQRTGDEAEVGHITCVGGDVVDNVVVRPEPVPLGGLAIHRRGHADPVVLTDDSVADLRKLLAEAPA